VLPTKILLLLVQVVCLILDVELIIMLTLLPQIVCLANQPWTNALPAVMLLVHQLHAQLVVKLDPSKSLLPMELPV